MNSFIINFQCSCLARIGTQASTHTVKCKEIKVHFLCKRFFWQELFLFLPLSLILSDPGFLYLLRFCKPLNDHSKVYKLCPVHCPLFFNYGALTFYAITLCWCRLKILKMPSLILSINKIKIGKKTNWSNIGQALHYQN